MEPSTHDLMWAQDSTTVTEHQADLNEQHAPKHTAFGSQTTDVNVGHTGT